MSTAVSADPWVEHRFAAMGTHAVVSTRTASADAVGRQVEALFGRVQRSCSRFDEHSDLSRVNADPGSEHVVSPECFDIIHEAHRAHLATGGLFDPRILGSLRSAGYDRSFDELQATTEPFARATPAHAPQLGRSQLLDPWAPHLDPRSRAVRVGALPIDLGGIGKGWTVDRAARLLAASCERFLVNAGGDLTVRGDGPTGDGWSVGVEDPRDAAESVAVLRLHDRSCATSSTARRSWRSGGAVNHHLIDPRTGHPAAGGVTSVTVVAGTTTFAETWSKALLIVGAEQIGELAADRGLAAYWIFDDGSSGRSQAMTPFVEWERS